MGKTIFIAGSYGVGKSTLCAKLSEQSSIPFFSAGDLISDVNGEIYGANKAVKDKNYNQIILADKVNELNEKHEEIILAGHFAIFNKANDIETLPQSVYSKLNIAQIILLEAEISIVSNHLNMRDNKHYSTDALLHLSKTERSQSKSISQKLKCPLSIHKMTFTDADVTNVLELILKEA